MTRYLSAAALAASFSARYPNAGAATLESISASAEQPAQLDSVQAMAFKGLSAPGKTMNIKATEHFYVSGELVRAGDIVEVPEQDGMQIVAANRAALATDDDVAAAQKTGKAAK